MSSQNSNGENYVTANRFYVEIEGNIKASFTECSGLGVTIQHEKKWEGGVNYQQRVTLKNATFENVTLKRGLSDDSTFWDWISQILSSTGDVKAKRRNINILVFNQAGETMQCWTLTGAVPVSWKSPSLQANASSVAIEELSLAYEGLKVSTNQDSGGATMNIKRESKEFFPGH